MRMHTHTHPYKSIRTPSRRSLPQQIVLAHAKIPSVESLERPKIVEIDKCAYVLVRSEHVHGLNVFSLLASPLSPFYLSIRYHNKHAIAEALLEDPIHKSSLTR